MTPDDDPREKRDIGSGYPEEQQDGANPGARKHEGQEGGEDAPGTAGGDDNDDPAAATGNPGRCRVAPNAWRLNHLLHRVDHLG